MGIRRANSVSDNLWSMLRMLLGRLWARRDAAPEEFRGRPRIRREKSYPADSGYVYQYVYQGYRAASRDGIQGRDFVFDCTSDRSSRFSIVIFAPNQSYAAWERDSGRDLNEVERYAIVKMRLFEIFDTSPHIDAQLEAGLTAEQVARQIEALDL